jgi:hypothetical protein
MDTYARSVVENFLNYKGCEEYGVVNDRKVWIKDDVIIIQIPTKGRIDYDQFETIAIDLLGTNFIEFDYWLGENT